MPEVSRFFGIVIRMFVEPETPHHRPHFHAYYQGASAVVAIDSIELVAGSFPQRQLRLVEAWAEIHREELLQDWRRLQLGQPPFPIEPLR
jgi:hypothetical protein